MTYTYQFLVDDDVKTVHLNAVDEAYQITIDDKDYLVSVRQGEAGVLHLSIDGNQIPAVVAKDAKKLFVAIDGQTRQLEQSDGRKSRRRHVDEATSPTIEASMTGTVLAVSVSEGEAVKKGQTLVLLEAMKMELRLSAPRDGIVETIHCQPGELVQQGQALVMMGGGNEE